MILKSEASSISLPAANARGPHTDNVLAPTSFSLAANDACGGEDPPPSYSRGSVDVGHTNATSFPSSLTSIASSTRPPHTDKGDAPLFLLTTRKEYSSEKPLPVRIYSRPSWTSVSHPFSSSCHPNRGVSERKVMEAGALCSSSAPLSSASISLSFSKGVLPSDGTLDTITTSAAQREDGAAKIKTPALGTTWLVQAPEISEVKKEIAVEAVAKKNHRTKSRSASYLSPQKGGGAKEDDSSRRAEMRLPRNRPRISMTSSLSTFLFSEASSSSASIIEKKAISSLACTPLTASSLDGMGGIEVTRAKRAVIYEERTPLKKTSKASPHLPEEKTSRKNSEERRDPCHPNEGRFHECAERTSAEHQDVEMVRRQTHTKKGSKAEIRGSPSSLFRSSHRTFSLPVATPRCPSSSSFTGTLQKHPKERTADVEKEGRRSLGTEGNLSSHRRQSGSSGTARRENHHQGGPFRSCFISASVFTNDSCRSDCRSHRSNSLRHTSCCSIHEHRPLSPPSLHHGRSTRPKISLHSAFRSTSPLRDTSSAPPIHRRTSLLSFPPLCFSEQGVLSASRNRRRSTTVGKERRVVLRRCSAPPLDASPTSTTVISGSSVKATFHTASPSASFAKVRLNAGKTRGRPVLLSTSSPQELSSATKRYLALQRLIGEEKAEKEAQRGSCLASVCIQEAQNRKNERKRVKRCTNKGEGTDNVRNVVGRNSDACVSRPSVASDAESSCGRPPDYILPFCRFRCNDTTETEDKNVVKKTYWRSRSANLGTHCEEWNEKKALREETGDEPIEKRTFSHTSEEQRIKRSAVTDGLTRSPSPKERAVNEYRVDKISPLSRKTTAHPHSVRDLAKYKSLFCSSERNHSLGMVHSLRNSNSHGVPHEASSDGMCLSSSMPNASCIGNERDDSPSIACTSEVADDGVEDEEWGVGAREWSVGTTATAPFESKLSRNDGFE